MKRPLISWFLAAFFLQNMAFGQSETYTVNISSFSSKKYDEFSPVYYRNGLVFCTNRKTGLFKNYMSPENKGLLKINFVEITGNSEKRKGRLFSKNLRTRFNDGPASFTKRYDTIYYSRNLKVDGSIRDISNPRNKLGIFIANYEDGRWVKTRNLRFNNEFYNITTPYISPDGKWLFFASDNPAGYGGTDLYYSRWKGDYWDEPVNLGPDVNTSGNESYPFVSSTGGLYFASDGHQGLGGKDIFFTKLKNGKWQTPVHLESPVNSRYDDFGLIADSVMSEGYFSSLRRNSFDVFHYKTNYRQLYYCENQRVNQYCFRFSDESNIPVDERYIEYNWNFGDGTTATGHTVEHCYEGPGKYHIKLEAVDKKTKHVFFTKMYYDLDLNDIKQPFISSPASALAGEPVTLDGLSSHFPGSDILDYTWYLGDGTRLTGESINHVYNKKGEFEVKLGLIIRDRTTGTIDEACAVRPIKVFDSGSEKKTYDSGEIKPEPLTDILAYDHAFPTNIYSSEKEYNQDMVFQLELIRSNTPLNKSDELFKKVPSRYAVKEIYIPDDDAYSYIVSEEMNLMDTYPSFNEMTALGYPNVRVRPFLLEDPEAKELNNIKRIFGVSADLYFRTNTYTLTSAGTQMLDLILGLMSKYPDIKLEIAVHTDNQGSANNNQVLSQRRADAMVNYLVINGISRDKMIAKGFGGTRPVASNTLETDRKLNRRIDFTIVK